MKNLFKLVFLFFVLFFITGCTSKITSENIEPIFTSDKKIPYSIEIKTFGGKDKNILGIQEVSNENLLKAVSSTIKKSQLFQNVVTNDSNITLELFIVRVGQPVAGGTMTVNVEIAWALKKEEKIIWKKSIITSSTKTISEVANAYNRIIEASFFATQLNIKQGLLEISKLEL